MHIYWDQSGGPFLNKLSLYPLGLLRAKCQGHSTLTLSVHYSAPSQGQLVQLAVFSDRLYEYHVGWVDPMKDECHSWSSS